MHSSPTFYSFSLSFATLRSLPLAIGLTYRRPTGSNLYTRQVARDICQRAGLVTCSHACSRAARMPTRSQSSARAPLLRTNGVDTNGAAAKVVDFDRLGKKVRPGTFGKIQVGQREYPKSPSVERHEVCSDPNSADPILSPSELRVSVARRPQVPN